MTRIVARSDPGPREFQEDALGWIAAGHSDYGVRLACLALDGIGGVHGGGIASRAARDALLRSLHPALLQGSEEQWRDRQFQEAIVRSAFQHAVASLAGLSKEDPTLAKMATTVAMTIHVGSTVLICHCGDTRVYAYGEDLELLTKDHTAAWDLVESGVVTLSEVRNVETRSNLTRFLSPDRADFDLSSRSDAGKSAYFLVTDGFWALFAPEELAEMIRPLRDQDEDPELVADCLLAEARRRELKDNATFILVCPERVRDKEIRTYPHLERFPAFSRLEEG